MCCDGCDVKTRTVLSYTEVRDCFRRFRTHARDLLQRLLGRTRTRQRRLLVM